MATAKTNIRLRPTCIDMDTMSIFVKLDEEMGTKDPGRNIRFRVVRADRCANGRRWCKPRREYRKGKDGRQVMRDRKGEHACEKERVRVSVVWRRKLWKRRGE